MTDETNQSHVEETNLEVQDVANPDGSGTPGLEESNAAGAESSAVEISADELAELRKAAEGYKNLEPEYRRLTQSRSAQEQELETLRQATRQLLGEKQASADPLEAARQRRAEALRNGDSEAFLEADAEKDRLLMERATAQGAEKALYQLKVDQGIVEAQRYGNYSEAQLSQTLQEMTPADLAMVRAHREGRLTEVLQTQAAEDDRRRRQAEIMTQLHSASEGSPGTVPGIGATQAMKRIDDVTFYLKPKSKQKELLDAGFQVYNNRTGELISG